MTLLLLLAACEHPTAADLPRDVSVSGAPPSVPAEAPPSPSQTAARPPQPQLQPHPKLSDGLLRWLRESSVTDERYARRTLYSWTSAATATRMSRQRSLFDDNKLPQGETAYVTWLEHIASRRDGSGRLARVLLGHPDLSRRRYAWARPWATRRGLAERDYGDRLIEVVLKPHALIGHFDASAERVWRFADLDQRPVSLARALSQPGRIAAVHHVRRAADGLVYREYVLCNESMVEHWSLGTEQVRAAAAQDSKWLRQWAVEAPGELGPAAPHWAVAPRDDVRALMATTLAFDVPRYQPTRANLLAIAERLDAAVEQHPLTVRPRRSFRANAAPQLVRVRQLPPRVLVEA